MGRREDDTLICDRCFRSLAAFIESTTFYRCAQCQPEDRQLLCAPCVAMHYRKKHPALWMEWVVPRLAKLRQK